MLRQLPAPYCGFIDVTVKDGYRYEQFVSSIRYIMEPGDILVGFLESGMWCPYPELYADGREVEPFELLAGPYIINYVYTTGNAEHVTARYISQFCDTVAIELEPYRFSKLVINPKTLNRLAGYREVSRSEALGLEEEFAVTSHSMGCFGGRSEELFVIQETEGNAQLRYRSYNLDTTLTLVGAFSAYRDQLQSGIEQVTKASDGCTTTFYYDIKVQDRILRLMDGSCQGSDLERLLFNLRSQAQVGRYDH